MYESPINIIFQNIEGQIAQQAEQTEQEILDVIRKCVVDIDKDELIKAINYDRNQYNKGYVDGCNDVLGQILSEMQSIMIVSQDEERIYQQIKSIIDKRKAESED